MPGMEGLPSGTVTFVFTDIEGSTVLLKQLGESYDELLTDHRRIVRDTFTRLNGVEIDTQGDAFFFAFGRARDAVEAAVEAQRAHASTSWPDDATVHVRMGLHTGEPALGSEGYLGLDVVRAARICTAAKGGNVLMSETTRLLVGSSLPEGVEVFPVGARHLKDIDQPEQVYELAIDGVEAAEREETFDAPPVPQPPPAPAAPARAESQAEFRDQLKASIRQRVQRELLSALGGDKEATAKDDDASVDELAERTADIGELIAARVNAALRAKGIDPEE
jgi:class 3 adenylate cyclase